GIAAAVARLDGMYAFVVLDRACGALHAVRDPVGIKPLYYIEDSGSIAFSSEVRGLAAHGFEPGALDEQAAGLHLQLRYVPSTMTLYRRTRRVAPGTILTWQVGRLGTTPFRHSIDDGWRTIPARSGGASSGRRASGDDLVTAFGARLDASVRSQLIADVPVGVLLSGGLDSAVLAATLARLGVAPPCFTVGFASADGRSETADAA